MILPFDYIKSFEDHRKDKRLVHSDKTLKNRLKNILPNQTAIKLFYDLNGLKAHESQLLKLYHFDDIPKSEYERILSNPLYFLDNQRNLRIFRFYLLKTGYSEGILTAKTERKELKTRKTSIVSNGEKFMDYQFTDKTKVNYQQPWKYIDSTIKNMEAQSKGINLSFLNNKSNQRKYSSIVELSKEKSKSPKVFQKGNQSPQTTKSLSTSFIFKMKQRETNTSKIKENLLSNQIRKSNSLRANFYSKIMDSELRINKIKENYSVQKEKIKSQKLLKTKNCQMQKLKLQKDQPQLKRHLSQLREICIKNSSKNFKYPSKLQAGIHILLDKTKLNKAKQRKLALQNILQKRLGIQTSSPTLIMQNPETQPQRKNKSVILK